jgi:hypothetical protein
VIAFTGCKEPVETFDPNTSAPVVTFAYDDMTADLNKADNLPVVAVVQSQIGLKSVTMKIETNGEVIDYKTVTDFFNNKSYSLAEKLNFSADYQNFIVEAVDKLDRKTTAKLPLNIVEVKEAPSVVFEPAEIFYDELVGGVMPVTKFTATSEAGLKNLVMYLVSESGQVQYGFPIDFTEEEKSYTFEQLINYKEGDKGFKVKVTDIYDQVRIETLPVKYLTPAPPTVTAARDTIYADKDETKPVVLKLESLRGIKEVKIFRIEKDQETLVSTLNYPDKPQTLNINPSVTFTNATSKIKFVVTDHVDKTTEAFVTAIVNMQYAANLSIGSHILANGLEAYPDVYALLSLNDLKTYSVDYALQSDENSANVDLKFYVFGGAAVLRMYSIDGGSGTKSNEFKGSGGKSVIDMAVQNKTRLLKLTDFDFDNATAESIKQDIPASNIVSNNINPFNVGDVLAFKTADTSTAGGDRIGIMKILSNEQVIAINPTARIIRVAIKFPKQ